MVGGHNPNILTTILFYIIKLNFNIFELRPSFTSLKAPSSNIKPYLLVSGMR